MWSWAWPTRLWEQARQKWGFGDATEGRIAHYNLVVLEDDKNFFPAYNPAPVIRKEILDTYPEIENIMKELSILLDLETLTLLNKECPFYFPGDK